MLEHANVPIIFFAQLKFQFVCKSIGYAGIKVRGFWNSRWKFIPANLSRPSKIKIKTIPNTQKKQGQTDKKSIVRPLGMAGTKQSKKSSVNSNGGSRPPYGE